jgi:hypothetical protein
MQNCTAPLAVDFEVELNGSSISVSLQVVFSRFLSKHSGTLQVCPRAGNRFQVAIYFGWFERCHNGMPLHARFQPATNEAESRASVVVLSVQVVDLR